MKTATILYFLLITAVNSLMAQGRNVNLPNNFAEKYKQLIAIDPYDGDNWHLRGITKSAISHAHEALNYYNLFIKSKPSDGLAYCIRGRIEMQLQQYGQAEKDFEMAIKLTPAMFQAYYYRGFAKFKLGDKDGAIKDCNEAINIHPCDTTYRSLGVLRAWMRQFNPAIEAFNKAIALNPTYVDAYVRRARVEGQMRHDGTSYRDFAKAIELDSNNAEAYIEWANEQENTGDYDRAITNSTKAISIDPTNPQAFVNRGWERERLAEYKKATNDFDKAINLAPNFSLAYSCRCVTKEMTGNLRGALRDCNKSVKIDTTSYYGYQNRAIVKGKLGNEIGSRDDFNKGVELMPKDSVFYVYTDSNDNKLDIQITHANVRDLAYGLILENANHLKTDLESQNLRGRVKQVIEKPENADTNYPIRIDNLTKIWRYNEQGYTIQTGLYRGKTSVANRNDSIVVKYNERGQKTEFIHYDPQTGIPQSKEQYNYDDKGQMKNKITFDLAGNKEIYYYDERGNDIGGEQISNDTVTSKWTVIYIYDDKGRKSQIVQTNGTDTTTWKYSYDPKGNTRVEVTSFAGRLPGINILDRRNRVIRYNYLYDPEAGIIAYINVKYDKYDNMIEQDDYYPNGKLDSKFKTIYQYDSTGNWIKRSEYSYSKVPFVTDREIEYY